MAFYSGFFNSKGLDRTYTAEDFTTYLSSIICNGILDTYGQMFKLTAASSGLKVTLGTGKAWINGHYFVGDYVTVQHRRFGMMQPQIQLIGMIEGFDQNGRSLTPTFKEA